MTKTPQKWLFDIIGYGELIRGYLDEMPDFMAYTSDNKTKLAVERCLEIVGEACHKLRKNYQIILSFSDRTYNFRGSLIHQYDEIKDQTIYQFALNDIPVLVREAKELMDTYEDD
ncbi:MAG: HepT-like ribonuclease domain-containing protein [Bacteroidia bacterium]